MLQSIIYKEAWYSGQVRIFAQRIATGEFEPDAADVSYRRIGLEHFNTTEARALALDTAVCTLSPSLPPSLSFSISQTRIFSLCHSVSLRVMNSANRWS
eukprot:COSAG03_NODE_716_length_6124_cov_162.473693_7_plen_99_part_00